MVKKTLNGIADAKWQLANHLSKEEWDEALRQFPDYNFYQSYAYGEFNKQMGWETIRLIAKEDSGKICGLFQAQLRRLPLKAGIIISTGGPLGDYNLWLDLFSKAIKKILNLTLLFARIFPYAPWTKEAEKAILKKGFVKVPYEISPGLSIAMDLQLTRDEIEQHLTKNWKKNLNRSKNKSLKAFVEVNPEAKSLMPVFEAMQHKKGLRNLVTQRELEIMFKTASKNLFLAKCTNENGDLLCFRIIFLIGNKAFDHFAASNIESRKMSASYFLLWEIIGFLQNRNITYYDLGGIDPIHGKGVYNFKQGLCKNEIRYQGEYDWSNWPLFGKLCSKAWAWRNKLR